MPETACLPQNRAEAVLAVPVRSIMLKRAVFGDIIFLIWTSVRLKSPLLTYVTIARIAGGEGTLRV